jgi:hypothetical protein
MVISGGKSDLAAIHTPTNELKERDVRSVKKRPEKQARNLTSGRGNRPFPADERAVAFGFPVDNEPVLVRRRFVEGEVVDTAGQEDEVSPSLSHSTFPFGIEFASGCWKVIPCAI